MKGSIHSRSAEACVIMVTSNGAPAVKPSAAARPPASASASASAAASAAAASAAAAAAALHCATLVSTYMGHGD